MPTQAHTHVSLYIRACTPHRVSSSATFTNIQEYPMTVCTYVQTYVYEYIYKHIYIPTQAYIHTYKDVHMYVNITYIIYMYTYVIRQAHMIYVHV